MTYCVHIRKNFLVPCHLDDVRKICTSSNIRSYTADMLHMSMKFMPLPAPQSALSFIVLLYGLSMYGSAALVDLGRGSARYRAAAYTWNNTNTE
jgi:hypothetical protein